jgi:hypothetical protein
MDPLEQRRLADQIYARKAEERRIIAENTQRLARENARQARKKKLEEQANHRRTVHRLVADGLHSSDSYDMSQFNPELERLYTEYIQRWAAEDAKKRRREAIGEIGPIALFAIAVTIALSIVWAYSSSKGSTTHPPATTATAQVPQPTVTIGQSPVTVPEPTPAQHSGPDYIGIGAGIGAVLAGIGSLLVGVVALLKLRRSREKRQRPSDPRAALREMINRAVAFGTQASTAHREIINESLQVIRQRENVGRGALRRAVTNLIGVAAMAGSTGGPLLDAALKVKELYGL